MRQIEDTHLPITPEIKDENSLHVHACVYLSDHFLFLSFFFRYCIYESILGCQLCMGHAVDKHLLSLVQGEVKGIIADLKGYEARLNAVETKLEKDEEARREGTDKILVRLVSMEKMLSEELMRRVEGVEQGLSETNIRVEGVEQRFEGVEQGLSETNIKVEVQGKRVEESLAAASFKVEELGQGMAQLQDSVTKTVEQLAHEIKSQRMEYVKPG